MNPPLRVLVDASPLVDGRRHAGIGRYAAGLLGALPGVAGLDVAVARPSRPPRSERWAARALHAQPALLGGVLRHRPAVVHCLAGDPAVVAPLGRQVVTVHDAVPWTEARYRHQPWHAAWFGLERRRLRRCAALIAVSVAAAAELSDALGVDRRRVHVIPEGVDPAFGAVPGADDASLRAAAGLGSAAPYVLWVGTMRAIDPRKALDVLVAAVAGCAAGRQPAPRLVLAGASGLGSRRAAELARAAGLELVLPGFVGDRTLAALLRGAAVVALPSRHEGFGLPALEAMACGAPLVVSRAGNLPALTGAAALHCEPGDPASLAAAIGRLLDGEAEAPRRREEGLRRAAKLTWERTARRTAAVYLAVAAARRGGEPGG